jgi:Secretion system C-terminal sorting domain/Cleaved Adhesin Domain
MKLHCLFLLVFYFFFSSNIFAQSSPNTLWDTIFIANLESDSPDEPINLNLSQPTGYDMTWVNYDEDGLNQTCDTITQGWYGRFESTFPDQSENYCFTSCSFLEDDYSIFPCLLKNRNWLIMPPITITGNNARLDWKSASYYGPYWVDGYKVLVSTTSNLKESFTDTLFKASEMIKPLSTFGLLSTERYQYSEGYLQADAYTLDPYYDLEQDVDGYNFWHGNLEPHSAGLSDYTGQTIYIAFLHDSQCDFQLQIDDIVVVDNIFDATIEKSQIAQLALLPNPTNDFVNFDVVFRIPTKFEVTLTDIHGNILHKFIENTLNNDSKKSIPIDLSTYPTGTYFCNMTTEKEHISKKIVKI